MTALTIVVMAIAILMHGNRVADALDRLSAVLRETDTEGNIQ